MVTLSRESKCVPALSLSLDYIPLNQTQWWCSLHFYFLLEQRAFNYETQTDTPLHSHHSLFTLPVCVAPFSLLSPLSLSLSFWLSRFVLHLLPFLFFLGLLFSTITTSLARFKWKEKREKEAKNREVERERVEKKRKQECVDDMERWLNVKL